MSPGMVAGAGGVGVVVVDVGIGVGVVVDGGGGVGIGAGKGMDSTTPSSWTDWHRVLGLIVSKFKRGGELTFLKASRRNSV